MISDIKFRTGRLVIGILSIILSVFMIFQSCAVSFGEALLDTGTVSGASGIISAALVLAAGITAIASRNAVSRGGPIACAILYGLCAFMCAVFAADFPDLKVYAIVSLVAAAVFLLSFMDSTVSKLVVIGLEILLIAFIAIGCNSKQDEVTHSVDMPSNSQAYQDSVPNEGFKEDTKSETASISVEDGTVYPLSLVSSWDGKSIGEIQSFEDVSISEGYTGDLWVEGTFVGVADKENVMMHILCYDAEGYTLDKGVVILSTTPGKKFKIMESFSIPTSTVHIELDPTVM